MRKGIGNEVMKGVVYQYEEGSLSCKGMKKGEREMWLAYEHASLIHPSILHLFPKQYATHGVAIYGQFDTIYNSKDLGLVQSKLFDIELTTTLQGGVKFLC